MMSRLLEDIHQWKWLRGEDFWHALYCYCYQLALKIASTLEIAAEVSIGPCMTTMLVDKIRLSEIWYLQSSLFGLRILSATQAVE